jgi:hypothetical protein
MKLKVPFLILKEALEPETIGKARIIATFHSKGSSGFLYL